MKLSLYRKYDTLGNSGVEQFLHDSRNGVQFHGCKLFADSEEGFGMPPLMNKSEKGPFEHGETFKLYRLAPRTIRLGLVLQGETYEKIAVARRQLVALFSPLVYEKGTGPDGRTGDTMYLYKYLGDKRGLRVRLSEGPRFEYTFADANEMRVDVELVAYRPLFFGNSETTTDDSGVVSGSFSFTTYINVRYSDWFMRPRILLSGPGWQDPKVKTGEGEVIELDGYTIVSFPVYMVPENREVYEVTTDTDLKPYMTGVSNLENFRLRPTTLHGGGSDTLEFSGSFSGSGTASVTIYHENQYLSA